MPETKDITGLGGGNGQASSAGVAFAFYFNDGAMDYVVPTPPAPNGGVILGNGNIDQAASEHAADQGKQDN